MRPLGPRSKRVIAPLAAAAMLTTTRAAHAFHEGDERIVDDTAHTLRARETRIGLWEIEFGPLPFVTIGTDTAPWAASFLVHSVVYNGHAKVRLLYTKPLTISVTGAAYYSDLHVSGPLATGSGSLWIVPLSLFVSSDVSRRVSLHLGGTYAYADAEGNVDLSSVSSGRGAIAANALQLHAMGEYRVSRIVAVTLQLHAQPYSTPLAVHTSTTTSIGDKIDFNGTISPVDHTSVAAVASVALSGPTFNVRFGGGYGAIFVPTMGVMVPMATFLPEVDAYVRF